MEQQRQREILKVIRKKMIPYKGVRIKMASDFSNVTLLLVFYKEIASKLW